MSGGWLCVCVVWVGGSERNQYSPSPVIPLKLYELRNKRKLLKECIRDEEMGGGNEIAFVLLSPAHLS